jgi:hypothetical protein
MTVEHNSEMHDTPAKIITLIFHPLLMPLYALVIIFFAPTLMWYLPVRIKWILFMVVLINNVILPLALIPFLRFRNIISSWKMEERSERVLPLLIVSILYSLTSILIFRFNVPLLLKSFAFSSSVLALILTVINFWHKISLHSAGAGALTAIVVMLSVKMNTSLNWYLVAVLIISGFILSGRLKLNVHNPGQVWTGFFTGLIVVITNMLLF